MPNQQLTPLLLHRAFAEAPRWRAGKLWYSDMHRQVVETVDLDGNVTEICSVPNDPSGLGWLPDGRLLVASMRDRRLLRQEVDGSMVEHADLSSMASWYLNDMVVDATGRTYVGNFGFDLHGDPPGEFKTGELIIVEPDGSARIADPAVAFPNGSVITPDGKTFIVGQSFGGDLLAYDIEASGDLVNRRQWAALGDRVPDGICLDAEGAVWFADPVNGGLVRVAEGGEVLQEIETETTAFACMLGGPEGRHLFALTGPSSSPAETTSLMASTISFAEVDVPGAGLP